MEFAIIVSVLMLLLFGIIQLGIFFNRYQGLQAGAREGGRLASLPQATLGQVKDRVRATSSAINPDPANENCSGSLGVDQYCITISSPGGSPPGTGCTSSSGGSDCLFQPCNLQSGSNVVVNFAYRTRIDIPLWSSPTPTMNGQATFRCE